MFSQKRKSTLTVLGPDIAIDGDLAATADLHLDGTVDGDIKCAALVQGETSEIKGMVVAESAHVAGKVKGSITADTLVILKTARIEGDVTYGTLSIEQGAQVEGYFSSHVSEPKLMLAGGTEAV
jgi:cytoskeletal protein CcmA (bactofilin family)